MPVPCTLHVAPCTLHPHQFTLSLIRYLFLSDEFRFISSPRKPVRKRNEPIIMTVRAIKKKGLSVTSGALIPLCMKKSFLIPRYQAIKNLQEHQGTERSEEVHRAFPETGYKSDGQQVEIAFQNLSRPYFVTPYFLELCFTTFSPIFWKPASFASMGMYLCISPNIQYFSLPHCGMLSVRS